MRVGDKESRLVIIEASAGKLVLAMKICDNDICISGYGSSLEELLSFLAQCVINFILNSCSNELKYLY